ncbi:DEKNAAC103101 [Brettanomyces naardenensis]|uniref:DEKNAAC103101 n=1 Tax=Brettanomyces naardenensis TaxID=13370 RepID=A0A448YM93_BRENA|nr:DEKNAAC103101 [Brettanomyces naardenensis]
MPFKLVASLQSPDSKSLWTRSIYALSTVSDVIKLTIRQPDPGQPKEPKSYSEILLTAINLTKTSSLNCSFRLAFFKTFQIDGVLPDGAPDGDLNRAFCFSILLNSKTLNVLFKDCGENSETFKLCLIHEDEKAGMRDRVFSNKLFIEFNTKTDMTKRYSVNFRPGRESFDLRIEHVHQEMLNEQSLNDEQGGEEDSVNPRVHHIIIDTFVLRNFIGMFPSSLEDFKIEVYPNARKLLFHGFNRQEALSARKKRLSALTSWPMSLSIQVSLNDLAYENIRAQRETVTEPDHNKFKHQVSLRLRDLRTFIQLISLNYMSLGEEVSSDALTKGMGGNYCEFMFTEPGCPIVFERRYYDGDNESGNECCRITLIEITDGEVGKVGIGRGQNALEAEEVGGGRVEEPEQGQGQGHEHNEAPARAGSLDDASPAANPAVVHERSAADEPLFVEADDTEEEVEREEFDTIFWDNRKYHKTAVKRVGGEAEGQEQEEQQEQEERPKQGQQEQLVQDQEEPPVQEQPSTAQSYNLGPTQNVTKFKGIFDQ